MEILSKIKTCDTMPKLDELRKECVIAMTDSKGENFHTIQNAFIKQKNKLERIPIMQRNW